MAELADALDLGSSEETREGSTPSSPKKQQVLVRITTKVEALKVANAAEVENEIVITRQKKLTLGDATITVRGFIYKLDLVTFDFEDCSYDVPDGTSVEEENACQYVIEALVEAIPGLWIASDSGLEVYG